MPKILAQAGISLADVYDVEGSIVGVEDLISKEVSLTHEMGAQIFSERLGAFIVRLESGDIAQSSAFAIDTVILPDTTHKIIGLSVFFKTAARLGLCSLSVANTVSGREIPIWTWDATVDAVNVVRWSDDGAGVANVQFCVSLTSQTPYMLIREGGQELMPHLIFRGSTLAFGAGTVEAVMLIHLARPNKSVPTPGEPSSHGLPLPGW